MRVIDSIVQNSLAGSLTAPGLFYLPLSPMRIDLNRPAMHGAWTFPHLSGLLPPAHQRSLDIAVNVFFAIPDEAAVELHRGQQLVGDASNGMRACLDAPGDLFARKKASEDYLPRGRDASRGLDCLR
jgi:hypothetical protein